MATTKQQDRILVSQRAAYLEGAKAAVTFTSNYNIFDEPKNPIPVPGTTGKKKYRGAVPWGKKNDLPAQLISIVGKNPIGSRCLEFKIELAYGAGPKWGKKVDGKLVEFTEEEIENDKKLQEIQEFFENNDIDNFMSEVITDVRWFYNGFCQFITDKNDPEQRKILEISPIEAAYSRWETANDNGIVENHFYSTEWNRNLTEKDVTVTPVIWSKNPILEFKKKIGRIGGKDERKFSYIMPIRLPSPGKKYYPKPYYYSIIESGWMDFANAIPAFKKALMTNQITVKYHIEIHEKYFDKIFKAEGLKTKQEQDARVKKEYENINKFLKGADNAGKTMITYYKIDNGTKVEISDIKIKVIENKLGGEYIEDSQEASSMTYVAFGVHPSLVGVIPGKTNSNLSGTDKRELLTIEQGLLARLRSRLLKPLYIVKAINKWPKNIHFWIPDLVLTTLDKGSSNEKVNN